MRYIAYGLAILAAVLAVTIATGHLLDATDCSEHRQVAGATRSNSIRASSDVHFRGKADIAQTPRGIRSTPKTVSHG